MNGHGSLLERRLLSNAMERKQNLELVLESITEDDLFESCNKELYRMMKAMWLGGYEVNLYTMLEKHQKELMAISFGGRSFLEAFNGLTLPGETKVLIESVKENARTRKVASMLDEARKVLENTGSADAVRVVENGIISLSASSQRTLVEPNDMGMSILTSITERMDEETRRKSVINTSFGKLNSATQGFEKGDLVILSAGSGAGKSAFAMNLCKDIAINQKRPTLYMNSEMSTEQMALRWGSFIGKVSHSVLRSGETTENQFAIVGNAAECFAKGKLYTLNIPDMQIDNVLAEVRRAKSRYDIEMVVVDYIGRMDTLNNKDAKEWQLLLNGARMLKTLAQELKIVVVMVAQLAESGGRLAQGSYMKFESDLWINIVRIDEDELHKTAPWNCYLEFRKARNSATGYKLMMNFFGDLLTFTDRKEEAQKFWNIEYPNMRIDFGGEYVKDVPV